jgi:integrase
MKPATIERFTGELLNLHHEYGINLATITEKQLLDHLEAHSKTHKLNSYRVHCVIIKHALSMPCLNRQDLAQRITLPRRVDPEATVKTIPREDRERLVQQAPTLQERLAVELLDETGARIGELWKLRIKDVQFEEVGGRMTAILRLDGKTGVRRRRVYASVADLRQQINNNPHRNDPEMTIFYKKDGKPFTRLALYRLIRKLGFKILERAIHPHQFRHSRATEDCRIFTDQEMMKLFGWKRPDQVLTYTHLSMKDVDEKDLVLHGLKQKEEIIKPIMEIQRCAKCGEENAPIALYCGKCGVILGRPPNAETDQTVRDLVIKVDMLEKALHASRKIE